MKKLLLVPALLLAACGDNLTPEEDQIAPTQTAEDDGGEAPADAPELIASFIFEPNDCGDHSVRFEGRAFYADGTRLDNPICQYVLADGTTYDGCFAVIPLPTDQTVALVVTDPATGATARDEEVVAGPQSLDVTLDVSSHVVNGMTWLTWSAESRYGSAVNVGTMIVDVWSPTGVVVWQDPHQHYEFNQSLQVTAPGTFTVTATAFLSFGEVGGCATTVEKSIEIACIGDAHAP